MNSAKKSTSELQISASQLLGRILVSDKRDESIKSNVDSVVGANCRSEFANMVHLVTTKSSEVVVIGFLQKMSTSLVSVMRYSQTAATDYFVSTPVRTHMAW